MPLSAKELLEKVRKEEKNGLISQNLKNTLLSFGMPENQMTFVSNMKAWLKSRIKEEKK